MLVVKEVCRDWVILSNSLDFFVIIICHWLCTIQSVIQPQAIQLWNLSIPCNTSNNPRPTQLTCDHCNYGRSRVRVGVFHSSLLRGFNSDLYNFGFKSCGKCVPNFLQNLNPKLKTLFQILKCLAFLLGHPVFYVYLSNPMIAIIRLHFISMFNQHFNAS